MGTMYKLYSVVHDSFNGYILVHIRDCYKSYREASMRDLYAYIATSMAKYFIGCRGMSIYDRSTVYAFCQ
jgi:hypothetical protein